MAEQYPQSEQKRILRDFEASKKQAVEEGDYLKTYYLNCD